MAKLTRYTSFEALKSSAQAAKATSGERGKVHVDFRELIKSLQRELAAKKKQKSSHE